MSQYEFVVEGDEEGAEKSRLDSASRIEVGDTVALADGSTGKVKDVTLNVATGRYEVTVKREKGAPPAPATAESPAAKQVAEAAKAEQAKQEGRAVKDVLFDPKFSPQAEQPRTAAKESKKPIASRAAARSKSVAAEGNGRKKTTKRAKAKAK